MFSCDAAAGVEVVEADEVVEPDDVVAPLPRVSLRPLSVRLRAADAELHRVEREIHLALLEAQRTVAYADDGHTSLLGWCRATNRWSTTESKRRIRAARLLDEHPDLLAAFERAEIAILQLDTLTRAAANPRCGHRIGAAMPTFVFWAPRLSHVEFIRIVREWEKLEDPDGNHRKEHEIAEQRRARLRSNDDGSIDLEANGGGLEGALIRQVFDVYVQREWDADWAACVAEHGEHLACVAKMRRTNRQRRFDALHRIFADAAARPAGSRTPDPLVNLVVDVHTMADYLGITIDDLLATTSPRPADTDTDVSESDRDDCDDTETDGDDDAGGAALEVFEYATPVPSGSTPTHPWNPTAPTHGWTITRLRPTRHPRPIARPAPPPPGTPRHPPAPTPAPTPGTTPRQAPAPGIAAGPWPPAPDLRRRRSETTDGHPIPTGDIIRAMLTGQLRRVITNTAGVVIHLGRRQRLFTGNARDAALLASTTCIWPGCDRPSTRCQADHLTDWQHHGRTDPDNGAPLCPHHNRAKNHGYTTTRDHLGTWHTHRPDGTEI